VKFFKKYKFFILTSAAYISLGLFISLYINEHFRNIKEKEQIIMKTTLTRQKICVTPLATSDLQTALIEGVVMCAQEKCDIEVTYNKKHFLIEYDNIVKWTQKLIDEQVKFEKPTSKANQ